MDRESVYYHQVKLLVRALPYVAEEPCFALKGGTAINLFVHNLPRLSVDIDLNYLPLEPRKESLANSKSALHRIVDRMINSSPHINAHVPDTREDALRAIVQDNGYQIKIELSPVLRGTVHPPEVREVQPLVLEEFGYSENLLVSEADLYGGKICAALDRQHPRDLFDIMLMLSTGLLNRKIFDTFLVYLVSSPRPMAELLSFQTRALNNVFTGRFEGMSRIPVTVEQLEESRSQLLKQIGSFMTEKDKEFLLSIKRREPDWSLSAFSEIRRLPAVRWKLLNLDQMTRKKHREALQKLEDVLNGF
jgi:hypothetical protein